MSSCEAKRRHKAHRLQRPTQPTRCATCPHGSWSMPFGMASKTRRTGICRTLWSTASGGLLFVRLKTNAGARQSHFSINIKSNRTAQGRLAQRNVVVGEWKHGDFQRLCGVALHGFHSRYTLIGAFSFSFEKKKSVTWSATNKKRTCPGVFNAASQVNVRAHTPASPHLS